jgi:hypothetical protein
MKIALVIYLWVACVLNLIVFRQNVLGASPDRARNTDLRFEALRRELAGVERIGYVSDPNATGDLAGERYFLAQLALAPVLVDLDTSRRLVVGNFTPGSSPSIPAGLVLVRDFGDGVVLFRRP